MEAEEKERSFYYRAIARHFFFRRGAPFLLSPRELEIMARWEAASIPLPVVLEGVDRAVEKIRKKKRPLASLSLIYCDSEVRKAFAQYKERRVGAFYSRSSQDKYEKIRQAIRYFLDQLPSTLTHLRPLFLEALEVLQIENKEEREKRLESLEENIEEALLKGATLIEEKEVSLWIEKEFPGINDLDKREIFRTALLKLMREKYRVPHLLACYY